MKVCKFGGSSVADASQIKKVKAILDSDKERTLVVVSAPGKRFKEDIKVTDMLYKCAALVAEGQSAREEFALIAERYRGIAEELGLGRSAIDSELLAVEEKIQEGAGSDYAASRGEHLNAVLISRYFGWKFLETEGRVIIGSDNAIMEETYDNLRKVLSEGGPFVIPGFYGSSVYGGVKTFSRGGSDITGAIIARAAMADVYENWTDVSGVFSSDPRVVPNAHVIPQISYREIREFGEAGAGVLHQEAIAPVVSVGIPINVKNTNAPEDKGTLITSESPKEGVKGVSARSGLTQVFVRKLLFFKEPGIRHKILSLMHVYGLKPFYTVYGCDSISWYFETKETDKVDLDDLCARLNREFQLDNISYMKGCSVIGLTGHGIEKTMQYVDALAALRENGIQPTSVTLGGSYTTFMIGVREEKTNEALNVISRKIFG